jgi:hypothetical protein
MTAWSLEAGFGYLIGIAAVTQIGLLLVYWGLWGDRSKGRARCPRCWYDLRGSLPKLECPECGHDAKHERRRMRRCWAPCRSPSMAACCGASGASTAGTTTTTDRLRGTGRRIARSRRRIGRRGTI